MADRNEDVGGAFKRRYTELPDGTNEYSEGVAGQGTHADDTADITTKAFPVFLGGVDANGTLQALTATVPAGVDTSGAFLTLTEVTANTGSDDVTNPGFQGLIVYANITAANDGRMFVNLQLKNDRTGAYHTINRDQQEVFASLITPPTEFAYIFYPGVELDEGNFAATGGIKAGFPMTIGKTFRILISFAGTTAPGWSLTVDYELL